MSVQYNKYARGFVALHKKTIRKIYREIKKKEKAQGLPPASSQCGKKTLAETQTTARSLYKCPT